VSVGGEDGTGYSGNSAPLAIKCYIVISEDSTCVKEESSLYQPVRTCFETQCRRLSPLSQLTEVGGLVGSLALGLIGGSFRVNFPCDDSAVLYAGNGDDRTANHVLVTRRLATTTITPTLQGGPAKVRPTYIFDGNI